MRAYHAKGAGLEFGVQGANMRQAGDSKKRARVVSRKAAGDFTGKKPKNGSNKRQAVGGASGLPEGVGELFEVNGPGQPKRAKTAFPLSKPHQAKTVARQAIIDERVKRNRAAAAERIQEGEKMH